MGHALCCTVPYEGNVSIQDIRTSRDSCSLCRLVWSGAEAFLGALFDKDFNYFGFEGKREGDIGPFRVDLIPSDPRYATSYRDRLKLQYYVTCGTTSPLPELGEAHEVGQSGLAESTISLAENWLKSCAHAEGKHLECAVYDEKRSQLPARVLDIGVNDSSTVKLHISVEGETGKYVALSHCWGGKTPIMTTAQNFEEHLLGIPQPLPQTFEDAVTITRELGLRYLWIDSLCIIQDSPDDWAIHAPHMAQVYGKAYVTISADAAENSKEGFLVTPDREKSASASFLFTCDGHEAVVHVRQRGALAYQLPYHSISSNIRSTPRSKLSGRGWVFQERVLSPRTLHFSEAETAWECRSIINCECSATSTRRKRTTCLLKKALVDMPWTEVIQEYTLLDLTVEEDRLVALSGLAEARYNVQQDEYFAGLWKGDLKRQLLWHRELLWYKNVAANRLMIAPTWSWASITGPVGYDYKPSPIHALSDEPTIGQWDILSVSCPPIGDKVFATCTKEANLLVHGYVIPIEISGYTKILPYPSLWYSDTAAINFTVHRDLTDNCFDKPIDCFTKPVPGQEFVLFMTSHPPHPPQGLILVGNPHATEEGETVGAFRRVAFVSAKNAVKQPDWSDDSSEEEEETDLPPVEMWKWKTWEANAKLQKFRIY
ncbi:HET-domain-containing protein [Lentithecium fluviatile CBS 122367]|uniref:HET-domain-containing protein n=1 Tax=Lentithecium fluviatile CBS 122367 TaxID=1168545 RepID=A0A6G1J718_9PLEO|nr:HET-domain-containing protein [Lentithecium fluviatile CBS 122367]